MSDVSDREGIAQVVHQKWANEWIDHFFELIAHSPIFGQKTSESLGKPMSEFQALISSLILNLFCRYIKQYLRTFFFIDFIFLLTWHCRLILTPQITYTAELRKPYIHWFSVYLTRGYHQITFDVQMWV